MLKRLGRRFYSAKYVFSIHLHGVSPWFMHERPAKISWKRGSKKHKKGQTSARMPVHQPGTHMNLGKLDVEENFELGVTLYAESNKTKKTGPYGTKDLKLVIMEIDDDGDIYSILGALTINLNEYTGLVDHKIKVPVECDAEIVEAVGQPYFDITIRSWYKPNFGGTSRSSGMSSTGWTAHGSDSDGEVNELASTGDSHFEPVKPIDALDSTRAVSTFAMDSVPEQIELDNTMDQDHRDAVVEVKTGGLGQTNQENSIPDETEKLASEEAALLENADAALIAIETKKNNIHGKAVEEDEEDDDYEASHLLETDQEPDDHGVGLPNEATLLTVGVRYHRLSTIDSEAGEEAMAMMGDENEDELKKFLASELKDDDMGLEAVPSFSSDALSREGTVPGDDETKHNSHPAPPETAAVVLGATTIDDDAPALDHDSTKMTEDLSGKQTDIVDDESISGAAVTDAAAVIVVPAAAAAAVDAKETPAVTEEKEVAASTTPVETEATVPVAVPVEPLPVSSAGAAVNKAENLGPTVAERPRTKPANASAQPRQIPRARPAPVRRGFWSCLPGSSLVCCQCQPVLPREA